MKTAKTERLAHKSSQKRKTIHQTKNFAKTFRRLV